MFHREKEIGVSKTLIHKQRRDSEGKKQKTIFLCVARKAWEWFRTRARGNIVQISTNSHFWDETEICQ